MEAVLLAVLVVLGDVPVVFGDGPVVLEDGPPMSQLLPLVVVEQVVACLVSATRWTSLHGLLSQFENHQLDVDSYLASTAAGLLFPCSSDGLASHGMGQVW